MEIEKLRLKDRSWKIWGPYLTDRQWGTVREDYSANGNAWDFVTHDMARSKAYRWGEEGIAGISDDQQILCFALALWNKKDPILKERFFGVTGSEGNHGEDVKEYYYYIDSTPTHSYMKMLYKYPQSEYPYSWLVNENKRRSRFDPEFELIDTGVFNEDKYFDVFVEYAKNDIQDILVKITIHNRSKEGATLNVLPTVWFRNTWAWGLDDYKPSIAVSEKGHLLLEHKSFGNFHLYCENDPEFLFADNETNTKRLYNQDNGIGFYKDGINDYIIGGDKKAINPIQKGTKAAVNYNITVEAQCNSVIRLRLVKDGINNPFMDFDKLFDARTTESDQFYDELQKGIEDSDMRMVQRQGLAGMMWSKQFYYFDISEWLKGDPLQPAPPPERRAGRNKNWPHLKNADIISMPDKWEYPWFAAWDLAFHTIPIALIDPEFAKNQLILLTKESYMHPNGQLPAYEWAFGDVNPPVHPWACYFVYSFEKEYTGKGDLAFLKGVFHKMLLNFTWWVNRKDPEGKNVFQGGFLGLDNIGIFDRSAPLPTGGHLEQADGTAWMAFFCQNMLNIALELAEYDPVYEALAVKFIEHFHMIASAMFGGTDGKFDMWDDEDHFFYDLLCLPHGYHFPVKIRSMVGLLPLCAATTISSNIEDRYPNLLKRVRDFIGRHPELRVNFTPRNARGTAVLSILNEERLRNVLMKMLDEREFFSQYGIRSMSRYHAEHPYVMNVDGQEFRVDYWPAESHSGMFGGNSNWRGPIWIPINALIIRALYNLYWYYEDNFKIECPTGSGKLMNLLEVNKELATRLIRIFLKDSNGNRPMYGGIEKFQKDPHWQNWLMFHEYFHGDDGFGLGANHQTGWSGFVTVFIEIFYNTKGQEVMKKREQMVNVITH